MNKSLMVMTVLVAGLLYLVKRPMQIIPSQESFDMNIYSYGVEGSGFSLSCTITNNKGYPITRQIAMVWGLGTYPENQAAQPRWWLIDEPELSVQWMTVTLPWAWDGIDLNYREAYSLPTATWDGHINEPAAVDGQTVWFAIVDDIGGVSNVVTITP